MREHVGAGAEEVDGDREQVVEVHGAGGKQALLVLAVDVGDAPLVDRARVGRVRLEVDQLVLGRADQRVHGAGRKALGVDVEVAHDIGGQALCVGLVVDRERRAIAQASTVAAQDANTRGVERRDPHLVGHRTHQFRDPTLHLVGGLVGERDGQDLERRDAPLPDQVRHAMGEHTRLPGSRAGHEQQRPAGVGHRLPLDGVQVLEEVAARHHHQSGATPTRWCPVASTSRRTPPGSRPAPR